MPIIIMKFGGSCLQDANALSRVLEITELYNDNKKIYVASAFKGVTDYLIETGTKASEGLNVDENIAFLEEKHFNIIEGIFGEESEFVDVAKDFVEEKMSNLEEALIDINEFGFEPYYQDYVMSFGEILSTYILHLYLKIKGQNVVYIPATELIITDDNFKNAYPLYKFTEKRIRKKMAPLLNNPQDNTIFCITGFIGRNKMGYITTLGRGGSDYTATILAHVIHEVCEDKDIRIILWKDVDGLLACDPKYITYCDPKLVEILDYNEAKEMAHFGAKVLHPKCLDAIEKQKIPLEIRNFDKPLEKTHFTLISEKTDPSNIKGISTVDEAAMVTVASGSLVEVPGVLAKIFNVMGKNDINVSLVAQSSSEVNTTFIVKASDGVKAQKLLTEGEMFKDFFDIKMEYVGIIAVIGERVLGIKTKARIFTALSEQDIEVKAMSQSSEGLNISIVIDKENVIKSVNTLHKEFH